MALNNTTGRYGTFSIGMHWLMFLLIVAVYASINLRELFPKGSDPREALKALHFMLGLTVFILVAIRLSVRIKRDSPPIYPAPVAWQRTSAKTVHVLLYGLMIVMPLLGWLTLSAAGKPIPFYGLQLPALISENKALGKTMIEIHKTIGTIGYYLIGIHTLAALFHHYIKRDTTLVRMLPCLKRKV